MLTFLQFLTEKFVMGFSGSFGYTEVYTKATPADLEKVGKLTDAPYNMEEYGERCYYAGAFVTPKDFIVFDRKTSEHHGMSKSNDVIEKLGNLQSTAIPVYVYWFPFRVPKTLVLALSSYSSQHGTEADQATLEHYGKVHPFLKKYKLVISDVR